MSLKKKKETIIIDETGSLGFGLDKEYIVGASVVKDGDTFKNCTEKYGYKDELKFRKDKKLRTPVVSELCFETLLRKKGWAVSGHLNARCPDCRLKRPRCGPGGHEMNY
ncbi:MAG: hypothetical protein WCR96_05555 [Candidatus Methanomethylophilaceae archaeon]